VQTHSGAAARSHGWRWPPDSVLGSLDAQSQERLLGLGTIVRRPANRLLVRPGELSAHVLILLSGVVKATAAGSGEDVLLAIRMAGDLIGEFTSADGALRAASIVTCGAVEARQVPRADFLDCLRSDARIAAEVNRAVVTKMHAASQRQIDFAGCDTPTRLARVLHELAVTYGNPADNRAVIGSLTQPELATLAGASESAAEKILRQWRTEGVVSTQYRQITMLDLARLSAIAYPSRPGETTVR
jgi:CRP/FNR family transcriptional regulator, cyclic AMP receptor protein